MIKDHKMTANQNKEYLTEKTLGEVLNVLYPGCSFVRDEIVPGSGIKCRPDYRNDTMMLIVEFDGVRHFQSTHAQLKDVEKDTIYKEMGYNIVRIPYFVQLSSETINHYFGLTVEWEQIYPHGFIDKKAVAPCDFNSRGYNYYLSILNSLPESISEDIIKSETDKFFELHADSGIFFDFENEDDIGLIQVSIPWFS